MKTIKPSHRLLAALFCLISAGITGCEKEVYVNPETYNCTQPVPSLGVEHPKHQLYNAFLQDWKKKGMPGAVLLIRDRHGLWAEGAGKADLANNVAMKACNQIYIASITKTFTAAAALRLHEKGLFDIDDPAINYLPELSRVPHGDKITIRQLLNHTSGIGGGNFVTGTLDYFNYSTSDTKRLSNWVDNLQKPRFAPGSKWEYSSGPDLVGEIMARVTGKGSAYKVIEDEVVKPLGLQHTYFNDKVHPAGLPKKYMDLQANGKIIELKVPFRPSADGALDFASGGGIGTAHDLMKFSDALFKDNLLKPETLELMKQAIPIPEGMLGWEGFTAYGLGVSFVDTPYGTAIGHEGDLFGASAFMMYFPEHDATVVGAMNVTSYPLRRAFFDYSGIARIVGE